MTQRWTDDRMDDLKEQVDGLGRRMEQGFAEQRGEMNARFDRLETNLTTRFEQVDKRFEQVDKRFEQVDKRFERVDERFERVDDKFEAIHNQIVHTQEMVISLHATLTRFSLSFLGAALVAIIAALAARVA